MQGQILVMQTQVVTYVPSKSGGCAKWDSPGAGFLTCPRLCRTLLKNTCNFYGQIPATLMPVVDLNNYGCHIFE